MTLQTAIVEFGPETLATAEALAAGYNESGWPSGAAAVIQAEADSAGRYVVDYAGKGYETIRLLLSGCPDRAAAKAALGVIGQRLNELQPQQQAEEAIAASPFARLRMINRNIRGPKTAGMLAPECLTGAAAFEDWQARLALLTQ